jgi:phage terminase large subunit-like protein
MSSALAAQPVRLRLYETQQAFVTDNRPLVAFVAGRNSGKTFAGATKAALKCLQPGLGVIAAPDFPMLEFAAKRQFKEQLDALGLRFFEQKSLNTLTIPATGAEVIFATLENESRIRGPNYHWAWPDEIEYVPRRQAWLTLKGAVRAGPNPQIFCTSTPKGRRLIWEEWVRDGDERHALYTASTFDNPFIDAPEYVRGLGYSGTFYAQEIDAQFVSFDGLVYQSFDRERHVQPVDTTGWATALGLDVGVRNPNALLTARHAGDRLHLERELYRSGMSSAEIVEATVAEYQRAGAAFVVVDPSAAGLIIDLQRRGLHVRKANNDIIVGIQRASAVLPHLTVDPSAVHFIAEIESYHYPERQAERDVPVKADDHLLDAWRYLCMELFGPRRAVKFM